MVCSEATSKAVIGPMRPADSEGGSRPTTCGSALFNHDTNLILGRNRDGTLRLIEDGRGLKIEIDPPDTQSARDLMVSIARGDITQMSFGFAVKPDGQLWEKDAEGRVLRTLT